MLWILLFVNFWPRYSNNADFDKKYLNIFSSEITKPNKTKSSMDFI